MKIDFENEYSKTILKRGLDYYNDGCDILTNVSVYSFPIEEVEIPEDNPPEEIENPETAAFLVNNISIICLLIMGLGAIIIANKSFRKIRFLR